MNSEGLPERPGAADDIVVTRIYYTDRADVRQHVDFDGKLWIAECAAAKTVAKLTPQQLLDGADESDPAALQALVWIIRKHRSGEKSLTLGQVDFDFTSVRKYHLDGEGYRVMTPRPQLDEQRIAIVVDVLRATLPALPEEAALNLATVAVVDTERAEAADRAGEDEAGLEPAAADDPSLTT